MSAEPIPPTTTILLLASDPVVRVVFREILERAGYVVVPESDLGDAVAGLKDYTPDLLLTRGYISEISGHAAAHYLRTKVPGIPVLIVGGMLDDDRLENRESLENMDVFPKPYSAEELLDKVKEVLAKRPAT
jgi:two-component system cell cycle sensor histidine kinase/response regulator CckA